MTPTHATATRYQTVVPACHVTDTAFTLPGYDTASHWHHRFIWVPFIYDHVHN